MSLVSSRSPQYDYNAKVQVNGSYQTDLSSRDTPIKRYMKQNNFYILLRQEADKKVDVNTSNSRQLTNLKQFQRSLQKQKQIDQQVSSPQGKNSQYEQERLQKPQYSLIRKNSVQKQYFDDDDAIFKHRTNQTLTFGNNIMKKIKSFIIDQKPPKTPRTPSRRKTQLPSYNVSSSIQKLHSQAQRKDEIRREQYANKYFNEEMKQVKQFKVDNPISLYLLQKRAEEEGQQKPLHQRAIQLAKQKTMQRLQKHMAKYEEEQMKQEQEIKKYQQLRKLKYPDSGNKEKQQQFYNELVMKEKLKNKVKQQEKIKHLKQITKQKPYVSKMSKDLFQKIIERDELSKDFLRRNIQYRAEKQVLQKQQLKRYNAEYYPFRPKISQTSKEIAKKYFQKKQKQNSQQQQDLVSQLNKKHEIEKKIMDMQKSIEQNRLQSKDYFKLYRRANSAHPFNKMQISFHREPNKSGRIHKKTDEKQIPIYNRINSSRKKTNSCYNLSCRK